MFSPIPYKSTKKHPHRFHRELAAGKIGFFGYRNHTKHQLNLNPIQNQRFFLFFYNVYFLLFPLFLTNEFLWLYSC
jgi:hypothetical protein